MTEVSESLKTKEAECAAGRTAPRVSLDDIQDQIGRRIFLTGGEAFEASLDDMLYGQDYGDGVISTAPPDFGIASLDCLTICLLVMRNGFVIVGKSCPASPENFNADLGKKLAYEDCIHQAWQLLGFNLRQKLAENAATLKTIDPGAGI